jgi:hypothetical protein
MDQRTIIGCILNKQEDNLNNEITTRISTYMKSVLFFYTVAIKHRDNLLYFTYIKSVLIFYTVVMPFEIPFLAANELLNNVYQKSLTLL